MFTIYKNYHMSETEINNMRDFLKSHKIEYRITKMPNNDFSPAKIDVKNEIHDIETILAYAEYNIDTVAKFLIYASKPFMIASIENLDWNEIKALQKYKSYLTESLEYNRILESSIINALIAIDQQTIWAEIPMKLLLLSWAPFSLPEIQAIRNKIVNLYVTISNRTNDIFEPFKEILCNKRLNKLQKECILC